MGYLSIDNLYKNQEVLMFKEVYCLEKIHGTSAHIRFEGDDHLTFFSGGASHEQFVKLFDKNKLTAKFKELFTPSDIIIVHGEAYGGKLQGMRDTYGGELKFVVFDVNIIDTLLETHLWLDVPKAEALAKSLDLEFVHYVRTSSDLKDIDAQRDADSEQAIRNSMGAGKKREGIIIRPIIELTKNNGKRIIAKHKRDEFRETATPRKVVDPAELEVLQKAELIAQEWVTPMRLEHVLQKMEQPVGIEKTGEVIRRMSEDIQREGAGEIVWNQKVDRVVGVTTAKLFKQTLKDKLKELA